MNQVDSYLTDCQEQTCESAITFEKSYFVPRNMNVAVLIKDMIIRLTDEEGTATHKLSISGPIVNKTCVRKQQSFCSEFVQMINNLIGLVAFEFCKYLQYKIGAMSLAKKELTAINESNTLDELKTHFLTFCRLLKPFDGTTILYKHPIPTETNGKTIFTDNFDHFDRTIAKMNALIREKGSASSFIQMKSELYSTLEELYDSIQSIVMKVDTIDKLVIMNAGHLEVLYDGSFIKLFDIHFRTMSIGSYIGNGRPSLEALTELGILEHVVKDIFGVSTMSLAPYIDQIKSHLNAIYKLTMAELVEGKAKIEDAEMVNLQLTAGLYQSLATITLAALIRIGKIIATVSLVDALTNMPRVQPTMLLKAILMLPANLDFDYTPMQKRVLWYVITCGRVAQATKQKRDVKPSKAEKPKEEPKEVKPRKAPKGKSKSPKPLVGLSAPDSP